MRHVVLQTFEQNGKVINTYTPRIRSVRSTLTEIKNSDPNSQITRKMISDEINRNDIRCFRSGRAMMVNLDEVLYYFFGDKSKLEDTGPEDEEKEPKMGEFW